jgi:hypothetical protein
MNTESASYREPGLAFGHTKRCRPGLTMQGLLFVALALVISFLAVLAICAYWAHGKLEKETSTPIPIPPIADPETVQKNLDGKTKETMKTLEKSKEGSLTVSSDEFFMLIRQYLPEKIQDSVRVTLKDDVALIQAPIKGQLAAEYLPKEWSTLRWYTGKLAYTNLEFSASISYASGRWKFQIREFRRPLGLPVGQLQGFIDELTRSKGQTPVKVSIGAGEATLSGLEIKDSSAVLQFSK